MLKIRNTLSILAAAAVVLLGAAASMPALADSFRAQPLDTNPDSSFNWAGYITSGGTYTAVSGTWTVPQVDTTGDTAGDVTWVGIGGVGSRDLIQAGTQAIDNGSGNIRYQAWYELLPGTSVTAALDVQPGDSVTATIERQGTTDNWAITLLNNTTGKSFAKTVVYASSLDSAEWIEEMPYSNIGLIPLDNFGEIQFTSGWTVKDGQKLSIADSGAQTITMLNRAGEALATPSALGTDGISFSVARSDAAVTPAYRVIYVRNYGFGTGPGYSRHHRRPYSGSRTMTYRFDD